MILTDYEITGFVNFPNQNNRSIKMIDSGKTMVYLVAHGEVDANVQLPIIGNFCGDDITPNKNILTSNKNIEDVINDLSQDFETKEYFNGQNFPLVTSILLGWSLYSYEYNDRINPWCCGFRELTNEGKKLYYSLKKLHNDCELRILTFNNIK